MENSCFLKIKLAVTAKEKKERMTLTSWIIHGKFTFRSKPEGLILLSLLIKSRQSQMYTASEPTSHLKFSLFFSPKTRGGVVVFQPKFSPWREPNDAIELQGSWSLKISNYLQMSGTYKVNAGFYFTEI